MPAMKLLLCFLVFGASLHAIDPQPGYAARRQRDYDAFLKRSMTPEAIGDCIDWMDKLIDAGEGAAASNDGAARPASADTKSGLHLEFRVIETKETISYYLVISRRGDSDELKYSDAAKFGALFADRAGLPHPVNITEGERPVFYVQWLIQSSEWKSLRKMMLKVRAENRAEKDPLAALATAVDRELRAREAFRGGR